MRSVFVFICISCVLISGCADSRTEVDVGITSTDIMTHVAENGGRMLVVRIHNRSDSPVIVGIAFFLGNPEEGGTKIGNGLIEIKARDTGGSGVPWAVSPGEHEVFVRLSLDTKFRDKVAGDNIASAMLAVEDTPQQRPERD